MPKIKKKKTELPSTQQYVPIKEIKEGVVIMKDGSLRSVIMVSSVNFALKNEDEKNAIITSYQNFLNSLNFPIQIMVRSRRLFLDNYINNLKGILEKQTNELLRLQTSQYIDYVGELLGYANIMEKRFFIVLSYYPIVTENVSFMKKLLGPTPGTEQSNFEKEKMEITQRVEYVVSGLTSVGMRCASLNTEDLIELYYTVYNPDSAGNEKLSNPQNLESPIIQSGGANAR